MKSPNKIELYKDAAAMTPMFPEGNHELKNLVATLMVDAGQLANAVNQDTRDAMVRLVEPMNSYYSNLIEGHNTHPLDIEKALKKDYSKEPQKKLLQLESQAHVYVHKKMKSQVLGDKELEIWNVKFIKWLHSEFYTMMPKEFHFGKTVSNKEIEVIPGAIREIEAEVADHIAPCASSINNFLEKFSADYDLKKINDPIKRIIASAASHHRLAWIHPFVDGNGRIIRLFTEAIFIRERIDGDGLWSISRGLAINKEKYYSELNNADQKRCNDYDGHGNLSNNALISFCKFFLETAIDQVNFMKSLLEIDKTLERIGKYVELMVISNELKPEAKYIIEEAFLKGKIYRGDAIRITGKSENTARKVLAEIIEKGLLVSKSDDTKTPLYINFPVKVAPYLFPKLFPSAIEATILD